MRMMLIGGGVLFSCIVWLVIFLTKREAAPVLDFKPADRPPVVEADSGPNLAALEKEAGSVARGFLDARTVDELLRWVRNPEVAEARMRRFYPDGRVAAPGLSHFNTGDGLQREGGFHSFQVLTGDQLEKTLAFVGTPQGLKVDWESWVGWSDIPWPEFISSKPAASHVFRVLLAPVDYYNFAFSDDTKWQCYRLESPDKEHAVFGYVERDSSLDLELRPHPGDTATSVMLALKFPPDPASDTQVIIERRVSNGWVEQKEKP